MTENSEGTAGGLLGRVAGKTEDAAEERRRDRSAETERELREGAARADETRAAVDEAADLHDAATLEAVANRAEARAESLEDEER